MQKIHNRYKNRFGTYPQAIDCPNCEQIVIAELDQISGNVTLYDLESYSRGQKIVHRHPVDTRTIARITERVTIEKHLLEDPDPDDWVYSPNKSQMENRI